MKFALIGLLILSITLSLSLFSSMKVSGDIREILELLEACEYRADLGDWSSAFEYSGEAMTKWEDNGTFFAIVMKHDGIDEVYSLLLEMEEYMRLEKHTEFKAANIKAQTRLLQLNDEERVRLINIF